MDFEFSWVSNIEEEYTFVELYGEQGGLKYKKGKLTLIEDFNGTLLKIEPCLAQDETGGNVETRYFVHCIKNDDEVLAKPEEAVTHHENDLRLVSNGRKGQGSSAERLTLQRLLQNKF